MRRRLHAGRRIGVLVQSSSWSPCIGRPSGYIRHQRLPHRRRKMGKEEAEQGIAAQPAFAFQFRFPWSFSFAAGGRIFVVRIENEKLADQHYSNLIDRPAGMGCCTDD